MFNPIHQDSWAAISERLRNPKQEAATIASEVKDITYDWSCDAGTGDKYGLLAEILGVDEYNHQTGISTYVKEMEPDTYDGTIDNKTPTHTRKHTEEDWECLRTCWYICKEFLKGATANIRDAINKQFYSQLKHRHTAYRILLLSKSWNTSIQHGALSTCKPKKNSRTPTLR